MVTLVDSKKRTEERKERDSRKRRVGRGGGDDRNEERIFITSELCIRYE
jgi:hypothetical protein